MFRSSASGLIAFACALNLYAADRTTEFAVRASTRLSFELQGVVKQPPADSAGAADAHAGGIRGLRVSIRGIERVYLQIADVNRHGEFHFSSIEPGDYTLTVVHPTWGELRKTTVIVSKESADRQGIVRVNAEYAASDAAANHTGTYSVKQLAIPEKAFDKYAEAQHLLEQRDATAASAKLQEAVTIAPEFAAAWNALGVITMQTHPESLVEPERYFRRAEQSDPVSFDPLVNLGGLLLKSQRCNDALPYNRRAVEARPNDGLANAQLGMNYYQLGQLDQAEPYLLKAKQLDPAQYSHPQLFLAEIYTRRGNRAAALGELEQLVKQRPDDPRMAAVQAAVVKLRAQ